MPYAANATKVDQGLKFSKGEHAGFLLFFNT